jgi:hypothetical protein
LHQWGMLHGKRKSFLSDGFLIFERIFSHFSLLGNSILDLIVSNAARDCRYGFLQHITIKYDIL